MHETGRPPILCGDDEDDYKSGRRNGDSDWISGSSLIIHAKQGINNKITKLSIHPGLVIIDIFVTENRGPCYKARE